MKPAEAVEFLLDALDVLTGCAPNEVHPVDEAIGHLPHLARRVAVALYKVNGRYLSADAIYAAMYFDRPADDTPDAKIVSAYVCKLRKRMPDGWSIKTHWGFGFSLQRPGVSS